MVSPPLRLKDARNLRIDPTAIWDWWQMVILVSIQTKEATFGTASSTLIWFGVATQDPWLWKVFPNAWTVWSLAMWISHGQGPRTRPLLWKRSPKVQALWSLAMWIFSWPRFTKTMGILNILMTRGKKPELFMNIPNQGSTIILLNHCLVTHGGLGPSVPPAIPLTSLLPCFENIFHN